MSCSNIFEDNNLSSLNNASEEQNAQKEFAIILSKALCSDPDMRSFVKQEALQRFDNDYDVFYPKVKDELINEKETFRDVLISYAGDKETFSYLESTLDKLTFLVPDWSWITSDCFSVKTWDVNDDFVCVGYDDGLKDHQVYHNGELFDTISSSEVTCYPVVIVKSNERIKVVSPATKGSEISYEFVSDAFDGSKRDPMTKASIFEHDLTYEGRDNSNFVPASDLSDKVIGAYNEFGMSWQNAAHRDYIYYGMSKTNTTNGIPNTFIRERLYRFKVNPKVLNTIKGLTSYENDPDLLSEVTIKGQSNGNNYLEEIKTDQRSLWADGEYEFYFQAYIGENRMPYGNNSMNITISVSPEELWYLNHTKVTRTSYNITNFKYKFEFNPDDLESKWYYFDPNDKIYLPYWDLSTQSYLYWFAVTEWDYTSATKEEIEMSYTYTDNFELNLNIPIQKTSLGVNATSSRTDVEKTTTSVTINNNGYTMGVNCLDYCSNVISSDRVTNDSGVEGYYVNNVNLGNVVITFLPEDMRD